MYLCLTALYHLSIVRIRLHDREVGPSDRPERQAKDSVRKAGNFAKPSGPGHGSFQVSRKTDTIWESVERMSLFLLGDAPSPGSLETATKNRT